jgi:hypothetical protein
MLLPLTVVTIPVRVAAKATAFTWSPTMMFRVAPELVTDMVVDCTVALMPALLELIADELRTFGNVNVKLLTEDEATVHAPFKPPTFAPVMTTTPEAANPCAVEFTVAVVPLAGTVMELTVRTVLLLDDA